MGLLSRLRAWVADLFGETGADEAIGDDGEPDAADESDGDDRTDEEEETTLDPAAATETRTAATDDAVDALRDIQRSGETVEAEDGDADTEPDGSTDRDRS